MKTLAQLVVVLSVVMLGSGCATSARITARPMSPLTTPSPKSLSVLQKATVTRNVQGDRVGRHTFTIFMIPTFPVHAEGRLDAAVGSLLIDALRQAGYDVKVVQQLGQTNEPVLALQVDSIRNYLFSWLYPIGITFGRATCTPTLFAPDGTVLWQGSICSGGGGSPSLLYMCGFDTSIKSEMTAVLRDVIAELQTPGFRQAVSNAQDQ